MRVRMQLRSRQKAAKRISRFSERGLSIIELTISMTLALIIMAATTSVFFRVVERAAIEGKRDDARADARLILKRLEKSCRLVGLLAPQDADGTADDITIDVPGEVWTDSVRDDFEYAKADELIFTSDYDNDGFTETVRLWRNGMELYETVWEWSRDSLRWEGPVDRLLADNVERMVLFFYDRNGNSIPQLVPYDPSGVVPLSAGERRLITEVEVILVTRSDFEDKQRPYYSSFPDGTYTYDGYLRFWLSTRIRGRNLWLG